ncbi:MAG TPA: UDP-N-acetylmuramate dehydrogenase [Myxococcales bacterium]|nr:UDP-N-acetylmuramate dehydrogenase [Myxococcales bacterium]
MIDETTQKDLVKALGERVQFDAPMSRHTSLRIGGPADALATPADRQELAALLEICRRRGLRRTIIGAGFNCLVADQGIDGVVITLRKFRGLEERPGPTVYAEAGVSHSAVTRFCVERGLSGMEFAAGIPGTVGGWIMMNAGIGVREQKDVALELGFVTSENTEEEIRKTSTLDFRYRELRGLPEDAVVVSALFALELSSREEVKAEVDRLLSHRSATQPLDVPSCGSVFRNPEGDFAGRLIEAAGLCGERVGGAEISAVHANFIANLGGARAADVLDLIERARTRVLDACGVELQTEVHLVGRSE